MAILSGFTLYEFHLLREDVTSMPTQYFWEAHLEALHTFVSL